MLGDLYTLSRRRACRGNVAENELWAGMQVAVCNALELELKNQVGDNK